MGGELVIVRAGAERVDELEPLWHALQKHHARLAPRLGGLAARSLEASWEKRREKYAAELADPDAFVLIAQELGRPVGYALVTLGEGSSGWKAGERVADVETLSVLPDARGRGVGSRLMDAVEAELARLGVRELRLLVIAPNAEALRFYEARGLTRVSHVLMGRLPAR